MNKALGPEGPVVENWTPRQRPNIKATQGPMCRLSPLKWRIVLRFMRRFACALKIGIIMPYGPFERLSDFEAWAAIDAMLPDPLVPYLFC